MQFAHAKTTVEAEDEAKAALLAWIDLVGKNRVKKLQDAGTTPAIVAETHSQEQIAGFIKETSLPLPGTAFIFDNDAEAWLISVVKPMAAE
jgi:hypothetical protein